MRTVRGIVVNDQQVKVFGLAHHGLYDLYDILLFIVRGYDDEGVAHKVF